MAKIVNFIKLVNEMVKIKFYNYLLNFIEYLAKFFYIFILIKGLIEIEYKIYYLSK
jgi:hypothetical protein